jgi:hypothetical protein
LRALRVDEYLRGGNADVEAPALGRERHVISHEHPGEHGRDADAGDVTPMAP